MDSLKGLSQIIVLAECGSYRKAAAKLGISHSALSQTVSKLEKQLRAPLFVRNKQETVPTAFGSRLLAAAQLALVELTEATRDISLMRNLEAGRLVIGCDPTVSEYLLAPALVKIMSKFPKLKFTVLPCSWRDHDAELSSKKIDFYLGIAPDRFTDGISYRGLNLKTPIIFCRAGHPLTKLPTVRVRDLSRWPTMGADPPDWFFQAYVDAFPRVFPTIDILRSDIITSLSVSLMKRIVLTTNSINMMFRESLADELAAGSLVELKVTDLPFGSTIPGVIATLDGRPEAPAATELMKQIHLVNREATTPN